MGLQDTYNQIIQARITAFKGEEFIDKHYPHSDSIQDSGFARIANNYAMDELTNLLTVMLVRHYEKSYCYGLDGIFDVSDFLEVLSLKTLPDGRDYRVFDAFKLHFYFKAFMARDIPGMVLSKVRQRLFWGGDLELNGNVITTRGWKLKWVNSEWRELAHWIQNLERMTIATRDLRLWNPDGSWVGTEYRRRVRFPDYPTNNIKNHEAFEKIIVYKNGRVDIVFKRVDLAKMIWAAIVKDKVYKVIRRRVRANTPPIVVADLPGEEIMDDTSLTRRIMA